MTPTWHVLGAGAMGTCIAHRLTRAGVSATLLHHEAAGHRVLVEGEAVHRVPVAALSDQAAGSITRLLLTTKAGQIAAALEAVSAALAADAVLLTTANGLGFSAAAAAGPGSRSLHRAVTTAAAFRDKGGRVFLAATGQTEVGDGADGNSPPDWFTDSLARLPDWSWSPEIDDAVLRKFAINCVINPLTAASRCRNGDLLETPALREDLAAVCVETEDFLRQLSLWPRGASLFNAAADVCAVTASNRSSMLQDVLAGRPTEIDFLTGHLLRLARDRGVCLPRSEALYRAIVAADRRR